MGSKHSQEIDSEVASATLSALLEDESSEQDIEISSLTNEQILTLSAALAHGQEAFTEREEPTRAETVQEVQLELQNQATHLFDPLRKFEDIDAETQEETRFSELASRIFGGTSHSKSALQMLGGGALAFMSCSALSTAGIVLSPLALAFVFAGSFLSGSLFFVRGVQQVLGGL